MYGALQCAGITHFTISLYSYNIQIINVNIPWNFKLISFRNTVNIFSKTVSSTKYRSKIKEQNSELCKNLSNVQLNKFYILV